VYLLFVGHVTGIVLFTECNPRNRVRTSEDAASMN